MPNRPVLHVVRADDNIPDADLCPSCHRILGYCETWCDGGRRDPIVTADLYEQFERDNELFEECIQDRLHSGGAR